jgi:hypothetical protein
MRMFAARADWHRVSRAPFSLSRKRSAYSALKTGFACRDELGVPVALVVLKAPLVDGKVEVKQQLRDLVHVVLEPDHESPLVGFCGEEAIEVELTLCVQVEPRVVLIAVDVVWSIPSQPLRRARSSLSRMIRRTLAYRVSSHRSAGQSASDSPMSEYAKSKSGRQSSELPAEM